MNSIARITLCLLLSSQAFGLTRDLNQMREDISLAKKYFAEDCKPVSLDRLGIEMGENSKSCVRDYSQVKKSLCSKKSELISYLEAILSNKNISVVAARFNSKPPADALGGVLLWQMKNSIDQVNSSWVNKVDRAGYNPRCAEFKNKENIKLSFTEITNSMKQGFDQTILTVETAKN